MLFHLHPKVDVSKAYDVSRTPEWNKLKDSNVTYVVNGIFDYENISGIPVSNQFNFTSQ